MLYNLLYPLSVDYSILNIFKYITFRSAWALVTALCGKSVAGWASMTCIVCFVSGVQLICLWIIGEYIGKIYMDTKARPRYIISERTWAPYERKYHG